MINLKDFELDLLKVDKKSCKNIGIYNIGHLTIKKIDNYGSIYSINPLYLQINYAIFNNFSIFFPYLVILFKKLFITSLKRHCHIK